MTAEEMKDEVRSYCANLIINSKNEEWDSNERYMKDNILIKMLSERNSEFFEVHIFKEYKDGVFRTEVSSIEFKKVISFWSSRKIKKEYSAIKKKYFEINNYFKNKKEYDKALELYNLLPLKVIRKNKLKTINENE